MKAAAALLGLVLALPAAAQNFPSRNIRFVVPFPPGGAVDLIARLMAQKYAESWNRPVLVENRAGGGTNIGAEFVAKSPPDGHTWLINSTAQAIAAALYRNLGYDPEKDLAPITPYMTTTLVLVASPKVPAQSLPELITLLRAQPGKYAFGTTGVGSGNHIALERFLLASGLKVLHVPYKGDAGLFPGLLANDVQFALAPSQTALAHIKAGRVRALAVAPARRSPALPDVPTMAEASGLTDYDYTGWTSLFATGGTPREVLLRINDETHRIVRMPDVQKNMETWGVETHLLSVDEFTARYRNDIEAFRKVVRDANIKVE